MLSLTLKVGQAIELGNVACIKLEHKSGQQAKLAFFTKIGPITLIPEGIIPSRYTSGITGELQRVSDAEHSALSRSPA